MLMAAVTSTLPGTDTANTRSASTGRTENAGMSFAESFEEGSVVPGGTEPPVADPIKSMATVGSEASTADKGSAAAAALTGSKAGGVANSADKIPTGPANMLAGTPGTKKIAVPVLSKTGAGAIAVAPRNGGKLSDVADTEIQPEMADGQSLSASSGSEKNHVQKSAEETDGKALDSSIDVGLEAEGTAPGKPGGTDSVVQRVVGGRNELPSSDKSQDTDLTKKMIKDHDTPVKAEKASKSAVKSDEKTGTGQAVVAAEGQTVVFAPAIVNPMGGQQAGSAAAPDNNLLSPIQSSTPGRSAAIAMAANRKTGKEAGAGETPDGDRIKASGSVAVEDAAPAKADADASKTGLAGNSEGDKTKVQSMAAPSTDAGTLRALAGTTGSIAGDVSGRALTHDAGANHLVTDAITHAVSTVQAGSNAADAVMPGDLAHNTLTVTPTSLEVGVSNGTHGWLKIRAEMADGGAVNTSLSPSSSSGQEMLHRELPSLTAYLHSEHVAVNTVVVQPAVATGTGLQNSFGAVGGGTHGHAQQSDGQGREGRQDSANAALPRTGTSGLYSSDGEEDVASSSSYAGGGNWLSVRA